MESVDEGNDDDEDRKESAVQPSNRPPSAGLNSPSVPNKATGQHGNVHALNRSADEQLPSSMCFVRLSDMNTEEWSIFLEKFQELLEEALHERMSAAGQRMKQRLGTSCKF